MTNWGSLAPRRWNDKREVSPQRSSGFVAVPRGTKDVNEKARVRPVKPTVDWLKGRVVFGP